VSKWMFLLLGAGKTQVVVRRILNSTGFGEWWRLVSNGSDDRALWTGSHIVQHLRDERVSYWLRIHDAKQPSVTNSRTS